MKEDEQQEEEIDGNNQEYYEPESPQVIQEEDIEDQIQLINDEKSVEENTGPQIAAVNEVS